MALVFILFMTTGGILINFSQLPAWLLPFKYISIFRYAMEVMSVNELHGLSFECAGVGCVRYVPNGWVGGWVDWVWVALPVLAAHVSPISFKIHLSPTIHPPTYLLIQYRGDGDNYLAMQGYPQYEDLWLNLLVILGVFVGCMGLTFLSLRRIQLH